MKLWKCALTGSVLTAMVFAPKKVHPPTASEARFSSGTQLASIPLSMPVRVPANLPARSPITAVSTAQKPLRGIRICIDPGHGGQARWNKIRYTGGTIGVATGQTESDVNLRVSLMLKTYLEAAGAEVIMTRISDDRCTNDADKLPELDFRPNLANSRGADLFISVHHNDAGRNPGVNYSAVFFPKGTMHSVSLAENIAQSLENHMGVPTKGALPGSYRVLSKAKMPSVIVEASFMTCPEEDRRLAMVSYNKLEAKAIATGIMNYIRLTKGRQVDFNTIFAPIDGYAGAAQAIADASFVRRDIVEKKSLFGTTYEEVVYDARGRVVSRREIGKTPAAKETAAAKSSVKKTTSKATSKVKSTASKARKATSSISKKASSSAKKKTSTKASATSKKSSSKRRG